MTKHSRIWVRLLVTSSKDMVQNVQEMFGWVSSAAKIYVGYLWFIFLTKRDNFK